MTVLVTGGAGFIGSHMVLELLDAGEDVTVLDNLSTGFRWAVPEAAKFVEGDVGDSTLLRRLSLGCNRRHHSFRRVDRRARVDRRSARLLFQQYLQIALADRLGGRGPGTAFHLLLDRGRLRHAEGNSGRRNAVLEPISPYGTSKLMTEIMLRDTARAHPLRYVALRYFNVAGADPLGEAGNRQRARRISSRSRAKPRSGSGLISKCSGPTIRRKMAPVSATISMLAISSARISTRCAI